MFSKIESGNDLVSGNEITFIKLSIQILVVGK